MIDDIGFKRVVMELRRSGGGASDEVGFSWRTA
jgi:hypothetical protein